MLVIPSGPIFHRPSAFDDTMLELPNDLAAFLRDGGKLEYDVSECECGQVRLLSSRELQLATIAVDGQSLHGIANDPNAGKDGVYLVDAVNLVASCEDHDPQFILAWLPKSRLYGSWDSDHLAITSFPGFGWSDIVQNPLPFINAQWDSTGCGVPLVPWPHYPFVSGHPE